MGNTVDRRKGITSPHLVRRSLYQGIYSRVARELGVHRSIVCRVAKGTKTSKRVSAALGREIARIEKLATKAA